MLSRLQVFNLSLNIAYISRQLKCIYFILQHVITIYAFEQALIDKVLYMYIDLQLKP